MGQRQGSGCPPQLLCGPVGPGVQAEALPGPQLLSVPKIPFQRRCLDSTAHVRDAADDL